jgi:uncharacterized protein (TIGR02246 family)
LREAANGDFVHPLHREQGEIMRTSISMALLGAAALSLSLGACTKSGTSSGAASPDSVKQSIKADEAKMNKQFEAKDTEGLAGHYTDDSYFVAPGVTADGSTAIRQVFANASTDPAFKVHFASDKIDLGTAGAMAYARGKFSEKYTDKTTGKVMSDSGTYLAVYKKQDDGSWKIVEDVSAVDPASMKPAPPEKPATRAKMTSF